MSDDDGVNPELTTTMVVLPNWRICYGGAVYEVGQVVELPLSVAVEWTCWGSVEPNMTHRWTAPKRRKRTDPLRIKEGSRSHAAPWLAAPPA
jgi:hypothetical protein